MGPKAFGKYGKGLSESSVSLYDNTDHAGSADGSASARNDAETDELLRKRSSAGEPPRENESGATSASLVARYAPAPIVEQPGARAGPAVAVHAVPPAESTAARGPLPSPPPMAASNLAPATLPSMPRDLIAEAAASQTPRCPFAEYAAERASTSWWAWAYGKTFSASKPLVQEPPLTCPFARGAVELPPGHPPVPSMRHA